jgi:hypothetical protein
VFKNSARLIFLIRFCSGAAAACEIGGEKICNDCPRQASETGAVTNK